jgi:hypothetical protein
MPAVRFHQPGHTHAGVSPVHRRRAGSRARYLEPIADYASAKCWRKDTATWSRAAQGQGGALPCILNCFSCS